MLAIGTAAIGIAGLMVGNELAVLVVHAVLRRLPDGAHASVARALAKLFGRVMPFWYAATLVMTLTVAVVFPWGAGSWLILGAAAVWAATIALAAILLAPLNKRVAAWDTDALPDDWLAQRSRWDRLHALRVFLLLVGWIALIAGVLMLSRSS